MRNWLPLCFAAAAFVAAPVKAQYLYMDMNGDGVCDTFDSLPTSGAAVDVWIDTTHGPDGVAVTCPTGEDLTISGYKLILTGYALPGSSVAINGWTNARPEFTESLGQIQDGNNIWVAYVSENTATHLAPGQHKLGTVTTTSAGCAWLGFRGWIDVQGTIYTTDIFSQCSGIDGDHILRLGEEFFDTCGTAGVCDPPDPPLASISTTWGKIKALYRGE